MPEKPSEAPNIPSTYRIQDGCHNCRHCRDGLFDDQRLFCVASGVEAPWPSWAPDRAFTDEFWQDRKAWEDGREVDPAGICDQHERRANG